MSKLVKKQIIGWREWVSFPELGLDKIKAKIDTGARSSALHAYDIETYKTRSGKVRVRFAVHPIQKNNRVIVQCHADLVDQRFVKSSSGLKELRTTVMTQLQMGDRCWPIELTLTNRDTMGFRLLIGRTAIKKMFLVDPQKSFLVQHN